MGPCLPPTQPVGIFVTQSTSTLPCLFVRTPLLSIAHSSACACEFHHRHLRHAAAPWLIRSTLTLFVRNPRTYPRTQLIIGCTYASTSGLNKWPRGASMSTHLHLCTSFSSIALKGRHAVNGRSLALNLLAPMSRFPKGSILIVCLHNNHRANPHQ